MSHQIKSAMSQGASRRKHIPRWLILVEGIILLAIGIFRLAQTARVGAAFGLLLGGITVTAGVILTIYAIILSRSARP